MSVLVWFGHNHDVYAFHCRTPLNPHPHIPHSSNPGSDSLFSPSWTWYAQESLVLERQATPCQYLYGFNTYKGNSRPWVSGYIGAMNFAERMPILESGLGVRDSMNLGKFLSYCLVVAWDDWDCCRHRRGPRCFGLSTKATALVISDYVYAAGNIHRSTDLSCPGLTANKLNGHI